MPGVSHLRAVLSLWPSSLAFRKCVFLMPSWPGSLLLLSVPCITHSPTLHVMYRSSAETVQLVVQSCRGVGMELCVLLRNGCCVLAVCVLLRLSCVCLIVCVSLCVYMSLCVSLVYLCLCVSVYVSLCACMSLCVCVCVAVCVYMHFMCLCMLACIFMCYVSVCMCKSVCLHVSFCVSVFMSVYVLCVYICVPVCVYLHVFAWLCICVPLLFDCVCVPCCLLWLPHAPPVGLTQPCAPFYNSLLLPHL